MSTPKVYIVQQPAYFNRDSRAWVNKYDLSAAFEYGEPVYLLGPGNIYRDRIDSAILTIQDLMDNFTSDDHILAVGDPMAIALTTMIASKKTNGAINMLKFDRISQRYESYKLSV